VTGGGAARAAGGVVGVVLAGGTSRRFGSDKALLRWEGKTFLELAARRLERRCGRVVVSVAERRPAYDGAGIEQVVDVLPGGGAAVGILSALRALGGRPALVCPVDIPLLPDTVLERLVARGAGRRAVILKVGGRWQLLVGLYGAAILPLLERCVLEKEERSIVGILRRAQPAVVPALARELACLVNVNTPGDFERLAASAPK